MFQRNLELVLIVDDSKKQIVGDDWIFPMLNSYLHSIDPTAVVGIKDISSKTLPDKTPVEPKVKDEDRAKHSKDLSDLDKKLKSEINVGGFKTINGG
jgi:hypothetical protein